MATLHVNGHDHDYDGDPSVPLLWVLRDEIGLTGTKFGCGEGLCGACTVHLAGTAVRSCQVAAGDAVGKPIVTIEGLDPNGDHIVQRAWRETNAPQCGYCHAGQIMQAAALLAANPKPTQAEILQTMAGNICRCGCYQRIAEAIRLAATGA
jgi:isoquinoline 1-oxidoreductase subunit alpha